MKKNIEKTQNFSWFTEGAPTPRRDAAKPYVTKIPSIPQHVVPTTIVTETPFLKFQVSNIHFSERRREIAFP